MPMFMVHGTVNGNGGHRMPVEADNPDQARQRFFAAYPGMKCFIEKVKLDKSGGTEHAQARVPMPDKSSMVEGFAENGWKIKLT